MAHPHNSEFARLCMFLDATLLHNFVFVFSRFATAAHVAIGLSGPVAFTVGPVLSSLWFPPNQRATATAIAMISGFAGAAGCFALGERETALLVFINKRVFLVTMHYICITFCLNIFNVLA